MLFDVIGKRAFRIPLGGTGLIQQDRQSGVKAFNSDRSVLFQNEPFGTGLFHKARFLEPSVPKLHGSDTHKSGYDLTTRPTFVHPNDVSIVRMRPGSVVFVSG